MLFDNLQLLYNSFHFVTTTTSVSFFQVLILIFQNHISNIDMHAL